MTDKALIFTPEKGGYSENHHFKTSLQKFDGENIASYNLQDQFNTFDEWDKFTINLSIRALGEKESGTLKSLIIEGINKGIYIPLWWSRMEMDGTFTGATVNVKDDSLSQNILEYTEFYDYWGYTDVRPNIKIFLRSASNIYNYELATLSSVNYGTPSITLSGSPTNTYVSGDLLIPAVKCRIRKNTNLVHNTAYILKTNIGAIEV